MLEPITEAASLKESENSVFALSAPDFLGEPEFRLESSFIIITPSKFPFIKESLNVQIISVSPFLLVR